MSLVHAFEHFKHLECLALELGGCRLGPETQNDLLFCMGVQTCFTQYMETML